MIKTLSKFESEMSYKVFFLKGHDITFDFIYNSFEIQILIKTSSKKIKSYQIDIYWKLNMLFMPPLYVLLLIIYVEYYLILKGLLFDVNFRMLSQF